MKCVALCALVASAAAAVHSHAGENHGHSAYQHGIDHDAALKGGAGVPVTKMQLLLSKKRGVHTVSTTFTGLGAGSKCIASIQARQTDYNWKSTEWMKVSSVGKTFKNLNTNCGFTKQCSPGLTTCRLADNTVTANAAGALTIRATHGRGVDFCPYNGYYMYATVKLTCKPVLTKVVKSQTLLSKRAGMHSAYSTFKGLTPGAKCTVAIQARQTDYNWKSTEWMSITSYGAKAQKLNSNCGFTKQCSHGLKTCALKAHAVTVNRSGMVTIRASHGHGVDFCPYKGYYMWATIKLTCQAAHVAVDNGFPKGTHGPTPAPTPKWKFKPGKHCTLGQPGFKKTQTLLSKRQGLHNVHTTFSGLTAGQKCTVSVQARQTDYNWKSTEWLQVASFGAKYQKLNSNCGFSKQCSHNLQTCKLRTNTVTANKNGQVTIRATHGRGVDFCAYKGYYMWATVTLNCKGAVRIIGNGVHFPGPKNEYCNKWRCHNGHFHKLKSRCGIPRKGKKCPNTACKAIYNPLLRRTVTQVFHKKADNKGGHNGKNYWTEGKSHECIQNLYTKACTCHCW